MTPARFEAIIIRLITNVATAPEAIPVTHGERSFRMPDLARCRHFELWGIFHQM
jgi:hypothetical protein